MVLNAKAMLMQSRWEAVLRAQLGTVQSPPSVAVDGDVMLLSCR